MCLSLIEMQDKEFISEPILSKVALRDSMQNNPKKCQFKISNVNVGSKESMNNHKLLRSVLQRMQ